MHNERKAFGRICPNRMGNSPSRSQDKKLTRYDNRKCTKIIKSNSTVPIYVEETPSIVDQAFATIAWQDLGDCSSVLRRRDVSKNIQEDTLRYDFQDFEDCAISFMPESPDLEAGLIPNSLLLSDIQECAALPVPSLQDGTLQDCLPYPSAGLPEPQSQLQPPALAEHDWRCLADQHHLALGDALEANSQLHLTLNERKEEIASLQEQNIQLKELANQAKHLASVLDRLMTAREEQAAHFVPPASDSPLRCGAKRRRLEDQNDLHSSCEDMDDILRDITERCNAMLRRDTPLPATCQEENEEVASPQDMEGINMYGSFAGIRTSTPRRHTHMEGGVVEEDSAFRTSIRDHCTIRTLTFPQGHAFTSTTPQGGYRFRWVPN
nr:multicilin [Paramormyrops kingsleyae]